MKNTVALTEQGTATQNNVVERLMGVWGNMDTGVNGDVTAIVIDSRGRVYIAGEFTAGGAAHGTTLNYIAYWDGTDLVAIGGGTKGTNGAVEALCLGADGKTIYLTGVFTTAGGGAAVRIAKYDPGTDLFSAMGTGLNGAGRALLLGTDGNIYIGGDFTSAGGVADTPRLCYWNGATYVSMDEGLNDGGVYCLAEDAAGKIFFGGNHTTDARTTSKDLNCIGYWVTSAGDGLLYEMDEGVSDTVFALLITPDNMVYLGGAFTTVGVDALAAPYLARWNGYAFSALAGGDLEDDVNALAYDPSTGKIWVGGNYADIDGDSSKSYVATWKTGWSAVDIDLPANFETRAIAVAWPRLYIGGEIIGIVEYSAITTVTNNGRGPAIPRFVVKRTGGTTLTVESFYNWTAERFLTLGYALLDGETLTINLETGAVYSDVFGTLFGVVDADSDMARWRLLPGANEVACFCSHTGAPTVGAFIQWDDFYETVDGAAI